MEQFHPAASNQTPNVLRCLNAVHGPKTVNYVVVILSVG